MTGNKDLLYSSFLKQMGMNGIYKSWLEDQAYNSQDVTIQAMAAEELKELLEKEKYKNSQKALDKNQKI